MGARRFSVWVIVSVVLLLGAGPALAAGGDIHRIRHVVVIMQENRSFDNYFGTFPGADGIPMRHGKPTVCLPAPAVGHCVRPYHDHRDVDAAEWHGRWAFATDLDNGRMDGFLRVAASCATTTGGTCAPRTVTQAVGYHDWREIPNYWAYARRFVLQDHMFAPVINWSLPAHLYMVSGWSALCSKAGDPFSCTWNIGTPGNPPDYGPPPHTAPSYAWTDLTYLLDRHHVSWGYYVKTGPEPDCENDGAFCYYRPQSPRTPGMWNPLPYFTDVQQDHQLGNIRDTSAFYTAVRSGHLPAVSWVIPSGMVSEHPPASISAGQAYVTNLIDAVARSREWKSTAIFLSWDDWGGFYDNVVPPVIDAAGYGFRVPGLVISAYARRGYIDHQELSSDAYLKFIEDDFLGGQRLNPNTDGRPDPRPDVREKAPGLGDLRRDFNFGQKPRPALILPVGFRQTRR